MKKLAPTTATNVIPLHPVNRLANSGYDSLIEDWLKRSPSVHTRRVYRGALAQFFTHIAEVPPYKCTKKPMKRLSYKGYID